MTTMTDRPTRAGVVVYGTGKLSADLLRYAPASGLGVVAVISADPSKSGADSGLLMLGRANGVPVLDHTFTPSPGTLCQLYGGNDGDRLLPALEWAAGNGLDSIVSISLAGGTGSVHPGALDELARTHGTRILSTGLLPGFQLDVAPALLATTVPDPVDVRVTRVSMISTWSDQVLRNEACIGRSDAEPAATLTGYMRSSVLSLQDALGIELDEIDITYSPVIADTVTSVGGVTVPAGSVRGFLYVLTGTADGRERVRVEWLSSTGAEDEPSEGTHVVVTGPDAHSATAALTLPSEGYPATAARMIKSVIPLSKLRPGLRSAVEVGTA